ncbi:AAA ATPase midasin, partial [Coemansia sp. RSA 2673]
MKWLAILVGPAGAGKTALVRWLANATGNKLVEFSMNSGVDTSEILGGFEQVDAQRHRSALLRRVDSLLAAAILGADYQHPGLGVSQACALYQAARNCEDAQDLCALVEQIAQYADDCGDLRLAELAAGVRCDAEAFAGLKVAGKFEWVDGVLVEALIHGHWLLIDRANLCSASVLDRLNGLLEPNGVLSLSRAMRNRGIEICVLPPSRELCEHGALHGVAVAQAVGLPLPLLPAAVATEPLLTSVVQQSAHIAECVQRGYTAELLLAPSDSSSAALVLARSPDPLESAVSEACWLAAMMEQAVGGEQSALQRERMLLAVLAAASPSADALAMRALQAIVRSDSVARLVAAPLTQAVVEAREQLAAEMARALDRCAGGLAAQRHHVLTESLHFQRERLVRSGDPAIDDVRELVLQRPSVDVTHVQAVFGLAEGCMRLVADWDAALLLGDPPLKAELLPALRAVDRLRVRVVELMGLERGAGSSALAVAFEGLAAPLALLADGGMRGSGELLAAARSLELDASHSTRAWAAAHPTTLPDDASRALEARLAAAVRAVSQVEPALRDAAIEALAMLYATAGRRDRHLVVAAITRFAQVLPQITGVTEGADETAVGPAAALGDVGELAAWRAMAQVAACAGSLPGDSDVGRRLVQALRGSVAATAVGAESAWALLFTRLAWAANDARASALLLPVTGDVDYQWHTRLGDSRLAALLAEPAHRLARPVATELAWAQAARFDCALGDHERAARESVELLRAVTVHRELPAPTAAAAAELAVLSAAVVQTAQAIGGDDVAAFVRASEQLLDVLIPGNSAEVVLPVAGELLDAWQHALPAAAGVVEPAARAVRAALEAEAANREALVLGAAVEVGLCQLRVAVPRRAVDP